MKLRILIADDESLARQRLRQFLRAEPRTELVAECVNGTEAVQAIREQSPDVVFLDVKMPELDGFGVLETLKGSPLPAIIFVTAYDQFAMRAFETHAVDYLMKPFSHERFQTALSRTRQRLQSGAGASGASSIADLLASLGAQLKPLKRLTIRSGDRIKLVKVTEIDWISSADNYVELHVGNAVHLMRTTLGTLKNQLPGHQFVQISRSLLVNLDRIHEIRCKDHGDYLIVLHNNTLLRGSRSYRQNLLPLLGDLR